VFFAFSHSLDPLLPFGKSKSWHLTVRFTEDMCILVASSS
jgi:hypothetical protein